MEGGGWLFQCPPGLATSLKKELTFHGAIERRQNLFMSKQRNHDLLFANQVKKDDGLESLRIAETVLKCIVYGRFKISQRQLQTMADELNKIGPRRLVVSVAGRNFVRQDLARWLHKNLSERGYDFDDELEEEVWMFCIDEAYYFGVPVIKAREIEGREDRTGERRGSLPAPVAAALVFALEPKNDDVVLDPTCGSGTLLAEFHAYAPQAKLHGFDTDAEAVAIARTNLPQTAEIEKGDARKLSLPPGEITAAVANLPFGKQFGDKKTNADLYRGLIAEAYRVRHPTRWRAIVFTSDTESLQTALSTIPKIKSEPLFRVKVRGELASAMKLTAKS